MTNQTPAHQSGDAVLPIEPKSIATFEALYDKYAPALFGVIHSIVPDDEMATEVLRNSFAQICKKIADYNADKMRLFTWMYHITKNVACEYKNSLPDNAATKTDSNTMKKTAAFNKFAKKYGQV